MKSLTAVALAITTIAPALCATAAWAQHAGHHQSVSAADLKWAAVPSLPKGAEIAVIEGPMNQAAPFTVRLRFPANYDLPAHTHPAVERVTVLSGTFNMGMGDKFSRSGTQAVRAGDMMIMQPGTVHYAWTDSETIVQLHGTGPWGITYINPNDDPRKQ
jgi:quercetin dioxygenase-like cupin family protein